MDTGPVRFIPPKKKALYVYPTKQREIYERRRTHRLTDSLSLSLSLFLSLCYCFPRVIRVRGFTLSKDLHVEQYLSLQSLRAFSRPSFFAYIIYVHNVYGVQSAKAYTLDRFVRLKIEKERESSISQRVIGIPKSYHVYSFACQRCLSFGRNTSHSEQK